MRSQANIIQRICNFVLCFGLVAGLTLSLFAPQSAAAGNSTNSTTGAATVKGIVRDGTPGGHTYPLYAKIIFTSPAETTVTAFSDPFSGAYSASLTLGAPYTATISPILPGYPTAQVSFTPASNPFTLDLPVQADLTSCIAPGYSKNTVYQETFDMSVPPALPAGWSQAKVAGTTGNWTTTINSTNPAGIRPFSLSAMLAFNSATATAADQSFLYQTTSTSLTNLSTAVISFWMYHDTGYPAQDDKVQAAVSTNGSTFYLAGSAFSRYAATPGWVYHQVDVSSYAGLGKPAVYIGLNATSAHGNDLYIDNIALSSSSCSVSPGGFVSGYVSSAPTGSAIISATVANTARPAEQTFSVSRGENPNLRDGFYQLFSTVSGPQNFSASAVRHQWAEGIVNVVNDGVTRLDLTPTSARVTANQYPLTVTLASGATSSLSLILTSDILPANYTLQPAASLSTTGSNMVQEFPYREEPATDPADTQVDTAEGVGPTPDAGPIDPNGILGGAPRPFGITTPFPGTAGYRSAAASCDGETFYIFGGQAGSLAVNEVWMYDPASNTWTSKAPMPVAAANMRAACIDGKIYLVGGYGAGTWKNIFQVYDTQLNSWTNTTQPVTGGPMVAAYNGLLYAMGGSTSTGVSNLAYVYNPSTAIWTPIANLPTAASYSGTVVYKNLIFLIGGAATADVQVYNPATNGWDNSGPDLPGPRMDPTVGWYGDQIYLLNGGGNNGSYWKPYPEGYTLNAAAWPGGSWTLISPTVLKPKSGPASICAGNRLWSVNGTVETYEEHITQFYDNGLMCNRTYPPVPWLTVSPESATIPQAGTRTVSIGFNANVAPYNTPGVYHAILKFNTDTAVSVPDIPVTMVVVQTNPFLSVTPGSDFKTVNPHKFASYTFTITNKTGATDDFVAGALGISPGWTAVISPSSFINLPNNGTATMSVKLYPPAGGVEGQEGVVSLTIKVHDNPSRIVSFSAIATLQSFHTWMPAIGN